MILDEFDKQVLSASGNAQKLMQEIYGVNVNENNAKKKISGIRDHLRFKKSLPSEIDEEIKNAWQSGMEQVQFKPDGSLTTKRNILLSDEDAKSPTRVMELMGYDPTKWKMITCEMTRNHWDVTMKLSQGTTSEGHKAPEIPVKRTNHSYSCRLVVKPIADGISIDIIKETFDNMQLPALYSPTREYNKDADLLFELPMMDLHLGKLAWGDETGEDHWNLKKAEKIYKLSIEQMIDRLDEYNLIDRIARIVFPIGQDFFHFDTENATTTKGTPMDTDTRWPKMFDTGVNLLIWTIVNLSQIAPVDIMWTPGNHDKMLSYFATYALSKRFENDKNVTVDMSPIQRKYYRWGLCLIGFAHGQDERKRIEDVMQVEAADDWGKTKFREFHLGHLHSEQVSEIGGLIVRHMGSITATDSWHKTMGFIGAVRKTQGIVWDKKIGKLLTIDVNVRI